jgi:hypothetical protein
MGELARQRVTLGFTPQRRVELIRQVIADA